MPITLEYDPGLSTNINFLRTVQEFNYLNDAEIKELAKFLKREIFEANEYVFEQGSIADKVYIVEDGLCAAILSDRPIQHIKTGELFGEIGMIGDVKRTASIKAKTKSTILSISVQDMEDQTKISATTCLKLYKSLARKATRYEHDDDVFYHDIDVLLIQDGGCAPGYNSVTGYVVRFLEHIGRRVFITKEGFKSLVNGTSFDFNYLINDRSLYSKLEHIAGVQFAPVYREARGASFRSERYKEFREEENQKKAAQQIIERKTRIVVGIGGDGTLKGLKALSRFLPSSIQLFFIPVTIDSDIYGTECIGEHTGVMIGSEKIRSYMADARSHHRTYIIEMMGRDGGYHALKSCLGAGGDMAVLPNFNYDINQIAHSLKKKDSAVIVVAEGYKRNERDEEKFAGNAADYFKKELELTGVEFPMRLICEGFSRDIRGAAPNYNDITLSQQMARLLAEAVEQGMTHVMPAVVGGNEDFVPFDEIITDNAVSKRLADLANRLIS
ncbi:cyclic nucleotide-binding domain-containing protein [bacterium]|nr:MAG: cyclic nucleotide-binding domain-containing protein [bacterium]